MVGKTAAEFIVGEDSGRIIPNPVFLNYPLTSLESTDLNYIELVTKHYGHCLKYFVVDLQKNKRIESLPIDWLLEKLLRLTTTHLETLAVKSSSCLLSGKNSPKLVQKFLDLIQNNSETLKTLKFRVEQRDVLKQISEVLSSFKQLESIDICIDVSMIERLIRSNVNLKRIAFSSPFGSNELSILAKVLLENKTISCLDLSGVSDINSLEECCEFFEMLEVNSSIHNLSMFSIHQEDVLHQFISGLTKNRGVQRFFADGRGLWSSENLEAFRGLLENNQTLQHIEIPEMIDVNNEQLYLKLYEGVTTMLNLQKIELYLAPIFQWKQICQALCQTRCTDVYVQVVLARSPSGPLVDMPSNLDYLFGQEGPLWESLTNLALDCHRSQLTPKVMSQRLLSAKLRDLRILHLEDLRDITEVLTRVFPHQSMKRMELRYERVSKRMFKLIVGILCNESCNLEALILGHCSSYSSNIRFPWSLLFKVIRCNQSLKTFDVPMVRETNNETKLALLSRKCIADPNSLMCEYPQMENNLGLLKEVNKLEYALMTLGWFLTIQRRKHYAKVESSVFALISEFCIPHEFFKLFMFRYFQGLSNDPYSIIQKVHNEELHLTPQEADFVDLLIQGEENTDDTDKTPECSLS
jgi:hypothetical protein